MTIIILLSVIFILFFTALLRLTPLWRHRYRGVDAYYFLLTAEAFKKQKKIPIKLPPYYLLDIEEQWYPPGFSVFLGLLPEKVLHEIYWLISPMLDVLNLAILLVFAYFQTFSLECLFLAGLIYGLTPILTSEYTTLTSRALGNLFLTGEIVSFSFYIQSNSIFFLVLTIVFGFTVFITHKMAMQFLCFFYICLSIIFQSIIPLLILILIFTLSLIILRGYFFRILRGYYDILIFWHKNWSYLGAHQVYSSPIYGKNKKSNEKKLSPSRKHYFTRALKCLKEIKPSLFRRSKTVYFLLRGLVGKDSNPFIILVLLSWWLFEIFKPVDRVIFLWAFLAFIWMLLTIFVPPLRLFGEGFKYMRTAAFPVAYIVPLSLISSNIPILSLVLVSLIFLFSTSRWFFTYRQLSKAERLRSLLNDDLMRMFEYIKDNPGVDYIACFSVSLADSLVYYCRRHVLWGTHHNSFNSKVVDFYPVLRKPLKWFNEKYGIKYVLVDTSYIKPEDIELGEKLIVQTSGKYVLYRLDGN